MRSLSFSIKVYAGIIIALAILLTIMHALRIDETIPVEQRSLLSPPALIVLALLGLAGVYLSERTGFAGVWDKAVPLKHKVFIPLLFGVAFGVGFMVLRLLQFLPDLEEPPFPASLLYFLYGGVLSEITFRLFPLPLVVWLISNLLLRGKAQEPVAWIAVVWSSLLEPLAQVGAMMLLRIDNPLGIAATFILVFSANLVLARLFRKYGFGASVVMRLAFYFVWHIIP